MTDIVDDIRSRRMPLGGTFELLDNSAAEIERLRAALQFYADPANYVMRGWQGDPDREIVVSDRGNIARAALQQQGNIK